MFSIGDTVFYETHGVCTIVDIQEQTFSKKAADYYILEPLQNESLKLYHPVSSDHSKLTPIVSSDIAETILDTFKKPSEDWNERAPERSQHYRTVLKTNDPVQIAQMVNTIMRKETELVQENKKLHSQDDQILKRVLPNLYNELAVSLNISADEVKVKIDKLLG